MASTRILDPVMHLIITDVLGIDLQAQRLLNLGMYKNTTEFPSPKVAKVVFEEDAGKLHTLVADSVTNKSLIGARNEQAGVVFGYLQSNLLYAKEVCNHNGVLIDLSGFDRNYMPEKATPPEAPVVIRVEKVKEAGTYKIFLKRKNYKILTGNDPKTHQRNIKYYIEITLTPDIPASWEQIEEGLASTKLFFTKVSQGKKNWVRVYGSNSAGKGQPSAPFPFTPEVE